MRQIRVKQENQQAVIEGLQNAGFTAKTCPTPNSETAFMQASFEDWDLASDILNDDLKGMAGIETSASGNQAHKVIQALKNKGVI